MKDGVIWEHFIASICIYHKPNCPQTLSKKVIVNRHLPKCWFMLVVKLVDGHLLGVFSNKIDLFQSQLFLFLLVLGWYHPTIICWWSQISHSGSNIRIWPTQPTFPVTHFTRSFCMCVCVCVCARVRVCSLSSVTMVTKCAAMPARFLTNDGKGVAR